jgi:hypothetical protein
MPKPQPRRLPLAVPAVLGLAGACALGAALIAVGDWQSSPDIIVTTDSASLKTATAVRSAKALRLDLSPVVLRVRQPASEAPPPPPKRAAQRRESARAEPSGPAPVATPAAPALTPAPVSLAAAPAADDAKLCRTAAAPPLDIVHAVKAETLKLSYKPRLDGRPIDIEPHKPPSETSPQGVRLSAFLADAVGQ